MADRAASSERKLIDLALQGGGAHGAFAWGVLDYLLEDDRIDFAGITAASAGAMNAAVMCYGLAEGGPEAARKHLDRFWYEISQIKSHLGIFSNPLLDHVPELQRMTDWLSYTMMESFVHAISPYQFNPLKINPLRDILTEIVDFDVLQHCEMTRLYISATNVRTGRVKVFQTRDVTADVIMASACLPYLYQAVEIDGEAYWDGGFSGNPPLFPLFYDRATRDLLVVHINPIRRDDVPKTSTEINNRINEISFNSSLLKEMRAVAFVQRLLNEDMLKDEYRDRYSNILFHSIRADKVLRDLSIASKYNTNWHFFEDLKMRGRETAKLWLNQSYDRIGRESTVDLHAEFLDLDGE
ncbi:patatin-like phospholipase family protein [Parvularcula flava]|uniref:Alpha/beta hydrolase n=1 Tax=Aquisalinus luteolus TaxID=1566827 RepID=A0A8J3A9T5_9PROT|nr:patatin-like phospholipase family protein [Aquisalinus luteolus]NHK28964.1 patatin-like phospholipase family protein [Aquisalinus luteolus]GGI00723.1 alpha/beta hydrolase [Aquisalinus luteolus]